MSTKMQKLHLLSSIFICGFFLLVSLGSCQQTVPFEKYNGVSLVASRNKITSEDLKPILEVNANSVAVMPFAFLESLESPILKFNHERQWYGERLEGTREAIQLIHEDSLKVMLKPQIWIRRGEFTGNIQMNSEADWEIFEEKYKEYILLFAGLAEEEKVEIFSLGTELNIFVNERPKFWRKLISDIRKIYSGKLTYAENWDKIEKVTFWKELDFIGVDAYFPLNENKSPTLEELRENWKPHKTTLEKLADDQGKPILFAEYGYRNIDFSTKTPWDAGRENKTRNEKLQADALEALYREIWAEPWFYGGFLWKWHHEHHESGGPENNQFTPQNKLAEGVVKEFYGKFGS